MAQAIKKLNDNEKTLIRNYGEGRGAPYLSHISESGFYKLVMRSDKEIVKPYQNWVAREIWFVGKDVCDALTIDTSNLSKLLDDDERSTCPVQYTDQVRAVSIINESGLYSLSG